jgi:hypothetical protein
VATQLRPVGQETDRRRLDEPRLHRRQFILGPEQVLAAEGWISEEIGPSLCLSRCPELPTVSVTDKRGVTWLLLGFALQSDPDAPTPLDQLAENEKSAPLEIYGSWSGRWILITGSEVHLDAGGLIGCFYRTIQHGSTTELWASSSPALVATIPGRQRSRYVGPKLHPGKGMDWYPLPRSGLDGVNKLLPTQVLSLAPATDRRVLPRPALASVQQPATYKAALDALQRSLVTSLSHLREGSGDVWLPLTAGFDSRLILAAARQADLSITTFTQHYPLMERGDLELPPLLASELGYEHRHLRPRRFSRTRRALFDAQTAGHCVDGDRRFFAHGQWEMIPEPAVILRGGVFELGRCYFHRKFPEPVARDPAELIATRFHFGEFHPTSSTHRSGISEWIEWTARTSQPGLDWRDRLYLEQRIAGWVSSIEQALDLTSYERAYIANSHTYMATVLALPEAARLNSQHHIDLIARMAPRLLRFPFNPADGRSALARRLRDEWRELAARPRKRRYAAYVAQRGAGRARQALARIH